MKRHNSFSSISIPLFNSPLLASTEQVMCPRYKHKPRHTIFMGKQGAVTVSIVKTPYLDRTITGASGDEGGIVTHV